VRTTYQFIGRLHGGGQNVEQLLAEVRATALRWVAQKYPETLPAAAARAESFLSEVPGQKLEGVALPQDGLWTLRLEQPDVRFADRDAIAGRIWVTDLSARAGDDAVEVAVRVQCASLPDCAAPIVLTRPRVVKDWARSLDLRAGVRLTESPWRLANLVDLDTLRALLTNRDRDLPVVVLTQPDRQHRSHMREWVLDEADLAKRLLTIAHVALLPTALSFEWTRMVGKPWSAYNGAVRVYQPGLDFELGSPFNHPLTTIDGILSARLEELLHERAFTEALVNRLFDSAASRRPQWGRCLFVPEARGLAAELDRQRFTETLLARERTSGRVTELQDEIRRLTDAYDSQLASIRQQAEGARQEAEEYFERAAEIEGDRDWYRQENANLRWQLTALRSNLRQRSGRGLDEDLALPDTYDDLPDWVGRNLVGRLVLHPRAVNAVGGALYENVELVCQALLLLANEYRDMRLGLDGARERFETRKNDLGVRHDESITRTRAGEQGDTYFVAWPVGSGNRAFLEHHLRKGSTKDDRLCLAIYFFWDDDAQQVVVGWLPSHLRNRMS
jgi:hypothetical protein